MKGIEELRIADITVKRGNRIVGGLDKDGLKELAASIKAVGVLEPIIVRPSSGKCSYELVVGERRIRACKLLKLKIIPATVRELDDQQAMEIRIIENLQRADAHPLDEAAGYRELLEAGVGDVSEVAARVGRSKSYVYGRLKLFTLVPEAQELMNSGALSPGAAVKLARLPEKAQSKVLKAHYVGAHSTINAKAMEDWTRYGGVMHSLSQVPFKIDDEELLPKAGSCTACPKRTGTDPTLFEESPEDECMDRACLKKKMNAWADLLANGKTFDIRIFGEDGSGVGAVLPTAKSAWEYERCKKSDEGALQALVVIGKDAGKIRWMKKKVSTYPAYDSKEYERERKERDIRWANRKIFATMFAAAIVPIDEIPTPILATVIFEFDRSNGPFITALRLAGVVTDDPDETISDVYGRLDASGMATILRALAIAGVEAAAYKGDHDESVATIIADLAKDYGVDLVAMRADARTDAEKEYEDEQKSADDQEAAADAQLSEKEIPAGTCRVCGCTDETPCVNQETGETCSWAEPDLCSACAAMESTIEDLVDGDHEVVDD